MLNMLKKVLKNNSGLYRYCQVEYGSEANAAYYMLTHGKTVTQVSRMYG